jgi:hypothetical protein
MVSYEAGLIIDDCLTVRQQDQRDLLVCRAQFGAQGTVGTWLYVRDLLKAGAPGTDHLIDVTDNLESCGESVQRGRTGAPVQTGQFRNVYLDVATGELVVGVEYGWRRFTDVQVQKCLNNGSSTMSPSDLPVTRTYRVAFHFDGSRFQLDPASTEAKRVVETVHE